MKFTAVALIATVAAVDFESMNEDELLVNLESTLSSALSSEARGDADAAVAKTAAIKNIQKALTARILKRLDDGDEQKAWTLVLCGHSLGAGIATVLALHLRKVFQNIRVWGIEPPGGLLSAELAASCREWTVSITHGCDIITRLSGPCLLKLRR